ncbi:hypothetical protein [Streptomyces sp. NRRL S-146]|uniref:hypothetical protein n=1 Tax=Streptomyces sp. NRRL S-146 TaxID=1463884 RepID=UPI00131E0103|nr:hypothetical protein [Streptomyces sp. NRRL S-146]
MLATFGHHAVAEGTVPWKLVGSAVVAQFVAVLPLARRRYTPAATVACTLVVQGVLHLALSLVDGDTQAAMPGHTMHAGHGPAAVGDGHTWHHAGAAMTTVHVVAALVVAWLLHRADARMATALGALGTLARAAAAALAQVLPRLVCGPCTVPSVSPDRRSAASAEVAAQPWGGVLEYAVVRRGPPRPEHLRSVTRPRRMRGRLFPYQQGVPLCPCPCSRWPVPAAVSLWPVPAR